jgi:hypothetical protein
MRVDADTVIRRIAAVLLQRAFLPDDRKLNGITDVIGESSGIHSGDEADCMFSMHMV